MHKVHTRMAQARVHFCEFIAYYKGMTEPIETAPAQEFHGLILHDFQLHGTPVRNPKPLLSELMFASLKNRPVRGYSNSTRFFTTSPTEQKPTPSITDGFFSVQTAGPNLPPIPDGRPGIEIRFAKNEKFVAAWQDALAHGVPFKISVRPEGIRIHGDRNFLERVEAHNRKAGYEEYKPVDGYARLYTFQILDVKTGASIIKVVPI